MRIVVHIKPKTSQSRVEKIDEGHYQVWVRAVPEKEKANKAMLGLLAQYFHVPKSRISIIRGKTAKDKLVEIQKYE